MHPKRIFALLLVLVLLVAVFIFRSSHRRPASTAAPPSPHPALAFTPAPPHPAAAPAGKLPDPASDAERRRLARALFLEGFSSRATRTYSLRYVTHGPGYDSQTRLWHRVGKDGKSEDRQETRTLDPKTGKVIGEEIRIQNSSGNYLIVNHVVYSLSNEPAALQSVNNSYLANLPEQVESMSQPTSIDYDYHTGTQNGAPVIEVTADMTKALAPYGAVMNVAASQVTGILDPSTHFLVGFSMVRANGQVVAEQACDQVDLSADQPRGLYEVPANLPLVKVDNTSTAYETRAVLQSGASPSSSSNPPPQPSVP